ncbi:MAG: aminotransferase class I/II-fold pyridoxal phosphate-dependent enzyme, partial [Venatoribacter sp.]
TEDELNKIIDIALRHNLIIVSDDIHCDLVLRLAPSAKRQAHEVHTPLATLAPPELRLITCISPSKTFNIPGLNLSALVASHEADKRAIAQVFARLHVNPFNPLSLTAFEAAYAGGEAWLEELLVYLAANQEFVLNELKNTPIHCAPAQATALMWLDCRALGLNNSELKHFFIQQAGLGLNDGLSFGKNGEGFMLLNIGTQRAVLKQAITQLKLALN